MKLNKEFLNSVLRVEAKWYEEEYGTLFVKYDEDNVATLNKYELMHKMKEWALTHGYSLQSNFDKEFGYCNSMPLYWGTKSDGGYGFTTKGYNEFEAVYNACLWILENQNAKLSKRQ